MAQASDPVGIVGAGPAGLAVGAALRRRRVAFEILDEGPSLGGIWDIDRARTPMYESAHFISSRTLSAFPGHPMPEEYPDYPRHDQILSYVRSYAERYDLARDATLGVRVTRAERDPEGGWTVATDDGAERRYRALCVATGANWIPRLPEVAGDFDGEAYHAFEYRSPEQFRDRRVLIVGAGNSGCDIACDAARVAERAFLSVRRGYHFVPKYVFGQPADVFAHSGPSLPAFLERRVFGFLMRWILVGDVSRFGLPRPDHDILESHPTMNTRVLHHLGHGDLEARGDVERLDGSTVHFADGRRDEVDVIVWATGYRREVTFLPDDLADPSPAELYLNLAHRRADDLFYIGRFETDGAAYPLLGRQGDIVASVVSEASPEKRARWDGRRRTANPDPRGGRHYLDSPRHALYVHTETYEKLLDQERKRLG